MNITKQIFLNIYHVLSTLVLLKYQDPFRESILNHAYLAAFLFGLKISAVFNMNCEFQYHYSLFKQGLSLEVHVCSYHLNIGQNQLNIALTM